MGNSYLLSEHYNGMTKGVSPVVGPTTTNNNIIPSVISLKKLIIIMLAPNFLHVLWANM